MMFSVSGTLFSLVTVVSVGVLVARGGATPATSHQAEVQAWQQKRDASLKAEESWLTLAGLVWLKEGTNMVGSDAGNDVVLPQGSAPARAGTLEFHQGKTTLKAAPGVSLTVNRKPARVAQLKSDESGKPDVVRLGRRIAFFVIKRGEHYGVRVKDNESKVRKDFKGIDRFSIQERFRIAARWAPYNPPRTVDVPNVLGEIEKHPSPGYAVFTLEGKEYSLVPYIEEPGDKELFYVFKDLTSGKETYAAGRFLYSPMPENGTVVLDFNKAYNPPCAFTAFATCPLPMKENQLQVGIAAGEKFHGH